MSSYYRQQLEDYLKTLDIKADRVLDVGGASNPVKGRVGSWDVKEYKFLDNTQEVPCGGLTVDYRFDLNDAIGYSYDPTETEARFDVAFCLEVMEYIYNPEQALENISHCLRLGGTLYITFNSLYPPHNPIEHDYLRHTKQGAVKLLETAGFKIEQIIPRVIHDKEAYKHYVAVEKYKCQGAIDVGTLYDAGYIVKAIKI